jgi:15-cis-phytoene desaturase
MNPHVVIFGGGVAGLSAAHELNERGFAVTVYEARASLGGKARSLWVQGTGQAGNHDLPGEHGFRFFPRFYRHLPDTLKRIPFPGNPQGVYSNLVEASRAVTARAGIAPIHMLAHFPRNKRDLGLALLGLMHLQAEFLDADSDFLLERTWQMATSCAERKLAEYEKINWWDFIDAERRSAWYQQFTNIVRVTVAANPRVADARTMGNMALQMLFSMATPGVSNDRLLNAPTNVAWIDPWVEHLKKRGVRFHLQAPLENLGCEGGRIRQALVRQNDVLTEVTGDYYLVCLPVEALARLLQNDVYEHADAGQPQYRNVLAADPSLADLLKLSQSVDWMNGIQFYLNREVPIADGHVIYIDSPWALSTISQKQFWPRIDLSRYGDGQVRDILSTDISNWDEPGILYGKPARQCTREEIKEETWAQLKRSLNSSERKVLHDEDLNQSCPYHLDPAITPDPHRPGFNQNAEPLLVNQSNTWCLRPEAFTHIPNLFLAADYVRTHTQLATMEAANEAARRAVNAILAVSKVRQSDCKLWPLHEPVWLTVWHLHDWWRFRQKLPWRAEVPPGIQLAQDLLFKLAEIEAWIRQRLMNLKKISSPASGGKAVQRRPQAGAVEAVLVPPSSASGEVSLVRQGALSKGAEVHPLSTRVERGNEVSGLSAEDTPPSQAA